MCASSGTCSGGVCSYTSTTSSCANGACQPCNAATCPGGCCSNNNCLDDFDHCRGTGGGSCTIICSGTCLGGCGYRTCVSGDCICEPLLVSQRHSLVETEICQPQ